MKLMYPTKRGAKVALILAGAVALTAPLTGSAAAQPERARTAAPPAACDPSNGGITLPDGFCATVFADGLTNARQVTVGDDGEVFVAISDARDGSTKGGIVKLTDSDGDGHADYTKRFGDGGGNGIHYHDRWLYFAMNDRIVRYRDSEKPRDWSGNHGYVDIAHTPYETLVTGLPADGDHVSKTVVVQGDRMLVNIGSASNACQVENRKVKSPGVDPCAELGTRAGVWEFSASKLNQTQADGVRFATGLRNMVALDLSPAGELFGVQNGRDQLYENWPDRFTLEDDLVLPAEEMFLIERDRDYGWPYCYFDAEQNKKVLAPEYGGDGNEQGRCASAGRPVETFPAHWAPLSMLLTEGKPFPEPYRNGAFVAFHGSRFDPASQPEGPGYNVAFVPFVNGRPSGDWSIFADGFASTDTGLPASAAHRPLGLAVGRDGALYITDDRGGRVWRVIADGRAPSSKPTPEMQVVIDAIKSFDAPAISTLKPTAARNLPGIPDWVAAGSQKLGKPNLPEPVADVRHVTIPSAGEELLTRVYVPAGTGPLPVLVYYHGGGWVVGNLSTYDASARALANASGSIVVSVAYRQAPENPFPTPMNDAWEAYKWVVGHASDIGGDPKRVAVGGESAGGNLATVVAMRARDEGFAMPTHQLLVYPVTNYAFDTPSYAKYANAVPLDRPSMEYFWRNYLGSPADGANPYASPLRAPSLERLPSATVILAEIDPLQSEGRAYAERLAAEGIDTTLCLYTGVTHEFFGMGNLLPEAKAAQAAAGGRLKGEVPSGTECAQLEKK
jgi:acetyl esterase/lipase/glucose/arabinose dehydrogenase